MMRIALVLCAVLISGCAPDSAVVADLESDKVIVQMTGSDYDRTYGEAQRACRIHGKGVHGPISETCADQYCAARNVLYACSGDLLEP